MKAVIATASFALAIAFSAPGIAASDHGDHSGHAAPQAQTPTKAQMVKGEVKKVDKAAGKVTLAHGPLANLDMPAMTMVFRVKDAAWLEQMKDGDKIRFMADKVDGVFTVVQFEAAK